MIKKIIVYSDFFNAPKELKDLAKELGYSSYQDENFVIDARAVAFVESKFKRYENIYKGESRKGELIRSGGFAQVVKVDTDRTWMLEDYDFDYDAGITGYKHVRYVDVSIDSNGRVTIKKEMNLIDF